ncbi:MAG TPA: SDR family oxidoreductase [Kofleriaceae bacterium]|jgi:NAD(P)-dependent dehydrogenase (short-subunit alcohol dehydrogenase family)
MSTLASNTRKNSNAAKTILITGSTAGIGRTTAIYLAQHGHHVIASGRKTAELAKLREEVAGLSLTKKGLARRAADDRAHGRESVSNLRPRIDTVELDVTNAQSIAAAVEAVAVITGGAALDVLVNNAGFGILGPTIEIDDAEMRRQYDTNVFGLMNVVRAFVPQMRDAGAGRVVNVSSLGGRITLPYFGVYNSTKYAIESLSDALRWELQPFGIQVSLIEPGVIRTNFEATAVSGLQKFQQTAYAVAISHYEKLSKRADQFAGEPITIAKAIERAVDSRRASARYVAPRMNYAAIVFKAITPTRVWDWAMRKIGMLNERTVNTKTIRSTTVSPVSSKVSSLDAALANASNGRGPVAHA